MDPELYQAVINGQISFVQRLANSNSTVLLQVTTQGDNILHIAAKYDQIQMAEAIIEIRSLVSLVNQKNSKGDTPLHIAARLGSFEITEILIKFAKSGEIEAGERLIRMVNMEKDTALHDAARNGHSRIAELLLREDPELTLLTNDVEESPLFIAVDKKHVDVAKVILDVAPVFSYGGRNKMNVLHAVVVRSQDEVLRLSSYVMKFQSPMNYAINMSYKNYLKFFYFGLSTILRAANRDFLYKVLRLSSNLMKFQNPMNYIINMSYKIYFNFFSFGLSTFLRAAYHDFLFEEFVERLTQKCQSALSETDEYNWTPLHYAVHFGAVYIVKLFLKYDSSNGYIRDTKGMSVIHIAAREGEVIILEMLANRFPQTWDLQDNNGQTALHLAVARGKLDSVKFILRTALSHDGLINQQDNEGNTALHLAAIQGHNNKIFELLIKDGRVNKTLTNMEGLTVIDIVMRKEYGYFEKWQTWILMSNASNGGSESLEQAINKNGRKTRSIETRKLEQSQKSERVEPTNDTQVEGQRQFAIRKAEPAGLKKASYEQLRSIASVNLLVTTLIATVSFAAGFTMPGGYKSDGPDAGMAILSRGSAFRVFVIANALAFCFSTTSMFLHYYKSFIEKLDVLSFYTSITTLLTGYGITAMVIAFVSGTYAALADSPGLAKAVLSIGCSFFGLQLLVYLK